VPAPPLAFGERSPARKKKTKKKTKKNNEHFIHFLPRLFHHRAPAWISDTPLLAGDATVLEADRRRQPGPGLV
jgi:hypothetical protein